MSLAGSVRPIRALLALHPCWLPGFHPLGHGDLKWSGQVAGKLHSRGGSSSPGSWWTKCWSSRPEKGNEKSLNSRDLASGRPFFTLCDIEHGPVEIFKTYPLKMMIFHIFSKVLIQSYVTSCKRREFLGCWITMVFFAHRDDFLRIRPWDSTRPGRMSHQYIRTGSIDG